MATVRCPACHAPARMPSPEEDAACTLCGGPLLLAKRYALVGDPPVQSAVDIADGAAPLWEGRDLSTGASIRVRLAPLGEAGRLDREATVLRGLQHARIPRVLDEVHEGATGRALILSHPGVPSLESALEQGLRVDARAARTFLLNLLEILAYLHSLSPPVFHRHVHPSSVCWDGKGAVALQDFTRATDVRADTVADPVLAREGYAPESDCDPVAFDLYGAAATTVHLLTRTPPVRLRRDSDGRPRFREAANVDERLAEVLDRLLSPGSRDAFPSGREAIRALLSKAPPTPRGAARGIAAVAGVAVAVATGATVWFLQSEPAPSVVEPVVQPVVQPVVPVAPPSPPPPIKAEVPPVEPPPAPTPTPPPQPTRKAAPRPAPKPAKTQQDDEHDRFLQALRRSVSGARSSLEACATRGEDRLRFAVEVGLDGKIVKARPKDQRASPSSSRCAEQVLVGLGVDKARPKPLQAEVTIYLRPSFRVTAF